MGGPVKLTFRTALQTTWFSYGRVNPDAIFIE